MNTRRLLNEGPIFLTLVHPVIERVGFWREIKRSVVA